MSHNLCLVDFPLLQTRTEFTWRVLESGMSRTGIAEAYYNEYLLPQVPVLRGKDARNPHLLSEQMYWQRRVDIERERLFAYLKNHPNVQWSST